MSKHTYKNPWHNPSYQGSTPFFTTDIDPVHYRGVDIFFYYPGRADFVINGVAKTQRACRSIKGAKAAVDLVLSGESHTHTKDFERVTA